MKKMLAWFVVAVMVVLGMTCAVAEVDDAVFEAFQAKLVDELEGTASVDCRYVPAGKQFALRWK